jgi:hypothetical protein
MTTSPNPFTGAPASPLDYGEAERMTVWLLNSEYQARTGLFSLRRIVREHPLLVLCALLLATVLTMCIRAVHEQGLDRYFVGPSGIAW